MRGKSVLLVLVMMAGAAGYGSSSSVLRADVPNPCPRFECRTLHAKWSTDSQEQYAQAFFVVGMTDATNNYAEDIFTPSSTEKKPATLSGKRDLWLFKKCTPMCGKDMNTMGVMTWQTTQEVVELGNGFQPADATNDRRICTSTEDGKGVKSTSQANTNESTKNPPGVDDNGDPADGVIDPGMM